MWSSYHSSVQKGFEDAYTVHRKQYDLKLEKGDMERIGANQMKSWEVCR